MTDEQKQTVAEARQRDKESKEARAKWNPYGDIGILYDARTKLLEIVDDLQKQVEQLTKERDEMREAIGEA